MPKERSSIRPPNRGKQPMKNGNKPRSSTNRTPESDLNEQTLQAIHDQLEKLSERQSHIEKRQEDMVCAQAKLAKQKDTPDVSEAAHVSGDRAQAGKFTRQSNPSDTVINGDKWEVHMGKKIKAYTCVPVTGARCL